MPWCPKCGYEYRRGFTVCADCLCELVQEDPAAPLPSAPAPAGWDVVRLAVVCTLAPWLWLFLIAATEAVRTPVGSAFIFVASTVLVFGLAFAYGYTHRHPVTPSLIAGGLAASVIANAILRVILVLAGVVPNPFKFYVSLLMTVLFSAWTSGIVWTGFLLRRRVYQARQGG